MILYFIPYYSRYIHGEHVAVGGRAGAYRCGIYTIVYRVVGAPTVLMVRHVPHILVADLFVPVVPVDAAEAAGASGAGAAAAVVDAGVAAVNASDGVAGADDALMLQFHHFSCQASYISSSYRCPPII